MTSYTHKVKIFTFVEVMATYCIGIATKYKLAALMLTHVVHSMKAYNCRGCGIFHFIQAMANYMVFIVWLLSLFIS